MPIFLSNVPIFLIDVQQIGAFIYILQFFNIILHNCTVALLKASNYPLSCCEVKALFKTRSAAAENGRTSGTSLQALVQYGNLRNVTYFSQISMKSLPIFPA